MALFERDGGAVRPDSFPLPILIRDKNRRNHGVSLTKFANTRKGFSIRGRWDGRGHDGTDRVIR